MNGRSSSRWQHPPLRLPRRNRSTPNRRPGSHSKVAAFRPVLLLSCAVLTQFHGACVWPAAGGNPADDLKFGAKSILDENDPNYDPSETQPPVSVLSLSPSFALLCLNRSVGRRLLPRTTRAKAKVKARAKRSTNRLCRTPNPKSSSLLRLVWQLLRCFACRLVLTGGVAARR